MTTWTYQQITDATEQAIGQQLRILCSSQRSHEPRETWLQHQAWAAATAYGALLVWLGLAHNECQDGDETRLTALIDAVSAEPYDAPAAGDA